MKIKKLVAKLHKAMVKHGNVRVVSHANQSIESVAIGCTTIDGGMKRSTHTLDCQFHNNPCFLDNLEDYSALSRIADVIIFLKAFDDQEMQIHIGEDFHHLEKLYSARIESTVRVIDGKEVESTRQTIMALLSYNQL